MTEIDNRLVHALQVAPRASWSAIAPAVGADESTIARHWDRLSEEGIVYASGHVGSPRFGYALMLVKCVPGMQIPVAERLAKEQEVVSVAVTAGDHDLVAELAARNWERLDRWIVRRPGEIDGILETSVHMLARPVVDGSHWHLRELTDTERREVRSRTSQPVRRAAVLTPGQMAGLHEILSRDGRASPPAIADYLDIPVRKVRDVVASLLADGRLYLRTDIAYTHTAWPRPAWYFMSCDPAIQPAVAKHLARMSEFRLICSALGPPGLVANGWYHSVDDVFRIQSRVDAELPEVRITNTLVVLRMIKHVGHLLDEQGRATGVVTAIP